MIAKHYFVFIAAVSLTSVDFVVGLNARTYIVTD